MCERHRGIQPQSQSQRVNVSWKHTDLSFGGVLSASPKVTANSPPLPTSPLPTDCANADREPPSGGDLSGANEEESAMVLSSCTRACHACVHTCVCVCVCVNVCVWICVCVNVYVCERVFCYELYHL